VGTAYLDTLIRATPDLTGPGSACLRELVQGCCGAGGEYAASEGLSLSERSEGE
jgi:hypothetical protein